MLSPNYGLHYEQSAIVVAKLKRNWDVEVERLNHGGKPSFTRAFFKTFASPLLLVTVMLLSKSACQLTQTQMLSALLQYYQVHSRCTVSCIMSWFGMSSLGMGSG